MLFDITVFKLNWIKLCNLALDVHSVPPFRLDAVSRPGEKSKATVATGVAHIRLRYKCFSFTGWKGSISLHLADEIFCYGCRILLILF